MTVAPPLLVIAGPTATGKTGLSIRIAESLHERGIATEIISADSRQVYRSLDIGTAKIPPADRHGVTHHGLDLAEPDRVVTLADYVAHVRDAVAGITARGALAILVGGTGLYLRAIARGIDTDALPADASIRARIEAEILADGVDVAAARLRSLAPAAASRVDVRNPRRVARALEIAELRGDGEPPALKGYPGPVVWLGFDLDAATHARWIEQRARDQFAAGLIDEARALRERFDPTLPPFSAIGYREAWSVIDGVATLEAAIQSDGARNVAFAKRQRTWFRSEPGIGWLDAGATEHSTSRAIEAALRLAEAG